MTEEIIRKGDYSLIKRGTRIKEFAVVNGYCKGNDEWNYTVAAYWYNGNAPFTKAEALSKAIDTFRNITESKYITRSRLEELATLFKDGLILDDEESAKEYFLEECEMEEKELNFFGIETEDKDDE